MWGSGTKAAKKRKRVEQVKKNDSDLKNEPKSVDELATHSRKIAEVRDWIIRAERRPKILLLTGPAGCGKTVTLKVVANEVGFEMLEWINPMEKFEFDLTDPFDETYSRGSYIEPKQADKFESFIFRTCRYKALFTSESRRLILIEDFPNYIISNPAQLRQLLCIYKKVSQCPIVFICTDDDKFNLSVNLFPMDFRCSLGIDNIKFNPVSHTALMKVLKSCCPLVPNAALENLARSSNGDIRAALTSLQFSSVENTGTVAKDVTTEYFKSLGRILYPKRQEDSSGEASQFLYDVRGIADQCTGGYLGMLHENYLDTFSDLKDVTKATEVFVDCDVLSNGGSELSPYVSLVIAAGLMCANKKPKKGSFKPLVKSRFSALNSQLQDTRSYSQFWHTRRVMSLDIIPYMKLLPRYAAEMSSFDADRLYSATTRRQGAPKSVSFKTPLPVKPGPEEDELDLLIEEFDD